MEYSPRFALKIARREDFRWLTEIDHVMGNPQPFFGRRFGRSYIDMAKDLNGIVIYDLAGKTFGKEERQL